MSKKIDSSGIDFLKGNLGGAEKKKAAEKKTGSTKAAAGAEKTETIESLKAKIKSIEFSHKVRIEQMKKIAAIKAEHQQETQDIRNEIDAKYKRIFDLYKGLK